MRARIHIFLCAVLLSFGAPSVGSASDLLRDVVDAPVAMKASGSRLSLAEVQTAIIEACIAREWTPRIDAPGRVIASITVRGRHYAEVSIPFDVEKYSILYQDSRNLDYEEDGSGGRRTIHRNYNKWVRNLSDAIDRTLRRQAIRVEP